MKKKILIIEDDPDIAKLLKMTLQKSGHVVVFAFDAITGRSAIGKSSPDLIILDISMPGGNGLDLAEFAITNPRYSGIPIIVLTANANDEIKAKAKELGVSVFLEKPFDPDHLLTVVDKELLS